MKRIIRDQANFLDHPHEGGISFDPAEDRTRQEFKREADANWLIKKYGGGIPLSAVRYGEQNFDLDLLSARGLVARMEAGFGSLPPEILKKYPTPAALLAAYESGELDKGSEDPAPSADS